MQRFGFFIRGLIFIGLFGTAAGASDAAGDSRVNVRPHLNLDGVWQFATDPGEIGESQQWYLPSHALPQMPLEGYAPEADGRIRVPGSWDTQGYGEPTDYRFHHHVGLGWYKKSVRVPADWAGQAVHLTIGGVHRAAKVWVNGELVGEHVGYLSTLDYDVSDVIEAGTDAVIVIRVDARRDPTVDPFNGTVDGIEMDGAEWGGIWGRVVLEARREAYLSDVFVQTVSIDDPVISVTGSLAGSAVEKIIRAEVAIVDQSGHVVAEKDLVLRPFMPEEGLFSLQVAVPDARLWSPEQPALYTARVRIASEDGEWDEVHQRFGIRQVLFEGTSITLNGRRILLAAAGDDNVYPNEFGGLYVSKDKLLARMRLMKSYGFNAVRTHSSIMASEFYEACDEVGMLVRPEMPFSGMGKVAGQFNKHPASRETARQGLANAVVRLRNHPSIYAWSGGNELSHYRNYRGVAYDTPLVDLFTDFKTIVKWRHPGAYFVDSMNTFGPYEVIIEHERPVIDHSLDLQRRTLDFISPDNHHRGHPYGDYGLEVSRPYRPKPVINHESHDYTAFPRLSSRSEFTRGIKPIWLEEMAAFYEKHGLIDEIPLWEQVSQELVMANVKMETEAMRLKDALAGYDFWLFQDFWGTANGLVDYFLQPKPGIPVEKFRHFNNDVVLLKTGLELTYRGGERMAVEYLVSNYSATVIDHAEWEVVVSAGYEILSRTKHDAPLVTQGGVTVLGEVGLTLPAVNAPRDVVIQARLHWDGRVIENDWHARLYPTDRDVADLTVPVYAQPEWWGTFGVYDPRNIPATGPLPSRAMYIVDTLDARLITAMEQGATVVLIHPVSDVLPVYRKSMWRAAFWAVLAHREFRSVGHLVYDHPATRQITPEHGLDHTWWHLFEDSTTFVLDEMPSQPDVLIRSIEGPPSLTLKALLLEARVGQGRLIASGLNHLHQTDRPEVQWVTDQLLQHAGNGPTPLHELSPAWLRERLRISETVPSL